MSRRGRKLRNMFCRFLCVLLALFCVPMLACAAGQENENDTSLTIHYAAGENHFSIYKVAAFSETGVFTLEQPFDTYTEEVKELNHLDDLDTEEWNVLAATLAGVAERDQERIQPLYQEDTDAEGNLELHGIAKGLYLIIGETTSDDAYIYTPSPILVTVPNRDAEGNWDCHPVIEHTKIGKEEVKGELTSYSVIKIWKDTGYEKKRPDQITVDLLQDGKVYDTVTLNQKNQWKYTWDDLEEGHEWKAVEQKVPDGYTMTSTQEGKTFVITNTYKKPGTVTPTGGSKLPQTGQLWWPVPLLAILGILACLVGYVWSREPKR